MRWLLSCSLLLLLLLDSQSAELEGPEISSLPFLVVQRSSGPSLRQGEGLGDMAAAFAAAAAA